MSTQAQIQADMAVLVNISTEKWPPRQRTYFGSLTVVVQTAAAGCVTSPADANVVMQCRTQ